MEMQVDETRHEEEPAAIEIAHSFAGAGEADRLFTDFTDEAAFYGDVYAVRNGVANAIE
jgi:hypothetical protein